MYTIRNTLAFHEAEAISRAMAGTPPFSTLGIPQARLLDGLIDPEALPFVAEENGEVLGLAICLNSGFLAPYIRTMFVSEKARGKGVGTLLLNSVQEFAFATKPNLYICVSSFNTEAKKLYERFGFVETGILKDYILDGYDEILMRKTQGSFTNWAKRKNSTQSS